MHEKISQVKTDLHSCDGTPAGAIPRFEFYKIRFSGSCERPLKRQWYCQPGYG